MKTTVHLLAVAILATVMVGCASAPKTANNAMWTNGVNVPQASAFVPAYGPQQTWTTNALSPNVWAQQQAAQVPVQVSQAQPEVVYVQQPSPAVVYVPAPTYYGGYTYPYGLYHSSYASAYWGVGYGIDIGYYGGYTYPYRNKTVYVNKNINKTIVKGPHGHGGHGDRPPHNHNRGGGRK